MGEHIATYLKNSLSSDLVAGLVIAALSIPISMGYAELAGMPAIYGLYAAIVAPIAFAILTKTRKTVFGMDSATVAMTASMLGLIGISTGAQTIAVMPILTLLCGVFLLLFAAIRAGTFIKMIPLPVIHGFIFGIAVTVIVGQMPHLMGLSVSVHGSVIDEIPLIVAAAPGASFACIAISLVSIALLLLAKRLVPKVPAAIIVLLAAAAAAQALSALGVTSIVYLPEVQGSLPMPIDVLGLDFSATNIVSLIVSAFAIAIVIALESLLCLEAFSSSESSMFSPNREMTSLGGSNVVLSLFACPPCSASMSRTAAGISSGAKSQRASAFSALVIAAVALFAGGFMDLLPRCVLSAIVVVALLDVVDWHKAREYVLKNRYDGVVFALSAALVIVAGAVVGIIGGILISVALMSYAKRREDVELVGAVPYPATLDIDKDELLEKSSIVLFKLPETLTFANVARVLDDMQKKADGAEALVLKASKVTRMDSSSADRLRALLDVFQGAGTKVKIVRKIRETKDHVTRYEIRRLMRDYNSYPSVSTALETLELEALNAAEGEIGTGEALDMDDTAQMKRVMVGIDSPQMMPVVTIQALRDLNGNVAIDEAPNEVLIEDVRGKLSLMDEKTAYIFKAEYSPETVDAKQSAYDKVLFEKLVIYDEANGETIMDWRDGHHELDKMTREQYDLIASRIAVCVSQILDKNV